MTNRTESDFIGPVNLPADALYGLQSLRARENFPDSTPFSLEWYKALGIVKQACYETCQAFYQAVSSQGLTEKLPTPPMPEQSLTALIRAAIEVGRGEHYGSFIVPALSGGAGTSINMNINEIIVNRALVLNGHSPGAYTVMDPIVHANIYQSTNDVVPTALKVAAMQMLESLEEAINLLRKEIENVETQTRHMMRVGRTQMQDAVPSSYGMLFSMYSEALSRDWWRVSKCFERIKVVNLGGGATGTGMGIPRFFIMEVVSRLQHLTGLPLTRAENLADATSNLDSFVEVHAILKAHAVNLEKMTGDLRLLASDISKPNDLQIPPRQMGSSIMPGKVNPVIPEFVISAAHRIYANDQIITSLSAQGCLDLNAYLPLIGHALLESLRLLIACDHTLRNNLFREIRFFPANASERLYHSPSLTTALSPYMGYHEAARIARLMIEEGLDIFDANRKLELMNENRLREVLRPENLLKLGFSIHEL